VVSHTFSPEASWRAEAVGSTATLAAAVLCVIVFVPSDGRIIVPLHAVLDALFGGAAFVLPLGLALAAGVAFARRAHPGMALPRRRMAGLGLITIALLPAERLMGQSTGLVGEWFTGFLLDLLGGPITAALTFGVLVFGAALAFALDLNRWRRHLAAR
jgi:hypothetical protein